MIEKSGPSHKLHFKEFKDGIKFSSLEKAYNFNEDLKKIYDRRRETIRSSICTYLEISY